MTWEREREIKREKRRYERRYERERKSMRERERDRERETERERQRGGGGRERDIDAHTDQDPLFNVHIALAGWALYTSAGGTHLTGQEWKALAPHKADDDDAGDAAATALALQAADHAFIEHLSKHHQHVGEGMQDTYTKLYYLAWLRNRPALHEEVPLSPCTQTYLMCMNLFVHHHLKGRLPTTFQPSRTRTKNQPHTHSPVTYLR